MRGAETAMATLLCDDYDIICLRRGKKAVKREKRGVLQRQHRVVHVRLPTLCYIFVQRIQCDPEKQMANITNSFLSYNYKYGNDATIFSQFDGPL